jgi:LacI family transcriptional regulator
MRQNRKSTTIHDVAKAAGVSVSTVSRVLNNKDDVALETYDRVQAVINELGYASSLAARGMRSQRTHVIGLIMPDLVSLYCQEIMGAVNRVIANTNYDLLVFTKGDIRKYHTIDQWRRHFSFIKGSIADGVIVVAPPAFEISSDFPLVVIDPNREHTGCPGIIATNREGALDAMRYLTGLGHRRIGHITGRLELESAQQRLEGYKEGLATAGIPLDENLIQIGDFTEELGIECAHHFFSLPSPPSAIFAASDATALGVYRAAKERGFRIPQDISVIGFDNLPEAAHFDPPLTTVDQSIATMGMMAAETLIKILNGETPEKNLFLIPTRLVTRASCLPQPL